MVRNCAASCPDSSKNVRHAHFWLGGQEADGPESAGNHVMIALGNTVGYDRGGVGTSREFTLCVEERVRIAGRQLREAWSW